MITNFIAYLQGFVGRKKQGWGKKVLIALLGLTISVAALSPSSAKAAVNGGAITQLEFLQWMVQLVGDKDQFNANSKTEDYVNWAKTKGMNPGSGWEPGAKLTRETTAQVLVQLFQLNPKKYGGDYIRILQREGIEVPNEKQITRKGLINLVSDFSFFEPFKHHRKGKSPHKHPNNGKGGHADDDDDNGNSGNHGNNDDDDDSGNHGNQDDDDDNGQGKNGKNNHNKWSRWW